MDLHESKRETAFQIADAAFKEYDPSSIARTIGVLDKLTKEIDWGDLSYFDAEYAFFVFKQKLAGLLEAEDCQYRANIETAIESMESEAKVYFENRIVCDTKGDHVADILVKMKEILDDEYISTYLRDALTSVKESCEKKIERQRERAEIRKDLAMFDEPVEIDRPNQFTRKQAIYLLQELIPEFKTADNTRKAEFITKLTGYTSTKNIADEFSNIRNFADPALLNIWKDRLKRSGRGRKKNNP